MSHMRWFHFLAFVLVAIMSQVIQAASAPPLQVAICGRRSIIRSWLPLSRQYGYTLQPIPAKSLVAHFGQLGNFTANDTLYLDRYYSTLRGDGAPPQVVILPLRKVVPNLWFQQGPAWYPANLSPEMQQALADYVRNGGHLILDTDRYLGDTTVADKVFPYTPGALNTLLPTEPLDGCPFTRGVEPELRPKDDAFTFQAFGKGSVLACDFPRPKEMLQYNAAWGGGQRYDTQLWGQCINWMVYGREACPITVDLLSPPATVVAGNVLTVQCRLERWATPTAAQLRCRLLGDNGENWATTIHPIRFTGEQDLAQAVALPVPAFAHRAMRVQAQVLSSDGKQLWHQAEMPVTVQAAYNLAITSEKVGVAPGEQASVAVIIKRTLALPTSAPVLTVQLSGMDGRVWDNARRTLTIANVPQVLNLPVKLPEAKGVYLVTAEVRSGDRCWQKGETKLLRFGSYRIDEQMAWTWWTTPPLTPEYGATIKQTLGNAVLIGGEPPANILPEAERMGFQVWSRNGFLPPANVSDDAEMVREYRKQFEKPLPEEGIPNAQHPLQTIFCRDGESGYPLPVGEAYLSRYHVWLQRQYGTLEALNKEWQTAYTSWDGIPLQPLAKGASTYYPEPDFPREDTAASQAPWFDQERFALEEAAVQERLWTQALHEADPYGHLTANPSGWAWWGGMDVLDLEYCKPWIPKEDCAWFAACSRPAFGDKFSRSTQWSFFGDARMVAAGIWAPLLRGSRYFDFWTDFSYGQYAEYIGYPSPIHQWMTFDDNEQPWPISDAVRDAIRPVAAHERIFLDAKNVVSTDVAIYTTYKEWLYHYGIYPALLQTGVDPAVITDAAQLARYKVVFVCGGDYVDAKIARAFADFVRGGGTLVTFPGLGRYNLHGNRYPDSPGCGLQEVIGLTFGETFAALDEKAVILQPDNGLLPLVAPVRLGASDQRQPRALPFHFGGTLRSQPSRFRDQIAAVDAGTRVLAQWEKSGDPAITLRTLGKGRALHVNFVFARDNYYVYRDEGMDTLTGLLDAVLAGAGAARPFRIRDIAGRPLPHFDAAMLQTDSGVRYLGVFCDYRPWGSYAADPQVLAGALQARLTGGKGAAVQLANGEVSLNAEGAIAAYTVQVPRAGLYHLWMRRYYDTAHAVAGRANILRVRVDGKEKEPYPTYAKGHGNWDPAYCNREERLFGGTWRTDAWEWESGQTFQLSAGQHTLEVEAVGAPIRIADVRLAAPAQLTGYIYLAQVPAVVRDAFRDRAMSWTTDSEGRRCLKLTLGLGEGTVLALLPAPTSLRVGAKTGKVARGSTAEVDVTLVRTGDIPAGRHAVQLTVLGPDGKALPAFTRQLSIREAGTVSLPIALNDPAGKWTVRLQDLTGGGKAKVTLQVQ